MWNDTTVVITNLYGMDFKPHDIYAEKRKAAIEYLGDKYLLSKPVERLDK